MIHRIAFRQIVRLSTNKPIIPHINKQGSNLATKSTVENKVQSQSTLLSHHGVQQQAIFSRASHEAVSQTILLLNKLKNTPESSHLSSLLKHITKNLSILRDGLNMTEIIKFGHERYERQNKKLSDNEMQQLLKIIENKYGQKYKINKKTKIKSIVINQTQKLQWIFQTYVTLVNLDYSAIQNYEIDYRFLEEINEYIHFIYLLQKDMTVFTYQNQHQQEQHKWVQHKEQLTSQCEQSAKQKQSRQKVFKNKKSSNIQSFNLLRWNGQIVTALQTTKIPIRKKQKLLQNIYTKFFDFVEDQILLSDKKIKTKTLRKVIENNQDHILLLLSRIPHNLQKMLLQKYSNFDQIIEEIICQCISNLKKHPEKIDGRISSIIQFAKNKKLSLMRKQGWLLVMSQLMKVVKLKKSFPWDLFFFLAGQEDERLYELIPFPSIIQYLSQAKASISRQFDKKDIIEGEQTKEQKMLRWQKEVLKLFSLLIMGPIPMDDLKLDFFLSKHCFDSLITTDELYSIIKQWCSIKQTNNSNNSHNNSPNNSHNNSHNNCHNNNINNSNNISKYEKLIQLMILSNSNIEKMNKNSSLELIRQQLMDYQDKGKLVRQQVYLMYFTMQLFDESNMVKNGSKLLIKCQKFSKNANQLCIKICRSIRTDKQWRFLIANVFQYLEPSTIKRIGTMLVENHLAQKDYLIRNPLLKNKIISESFKNSYYQNYLQYTKQGNKILNKEKEQIYRLSIIQWLGLLEMHEGRFDEIKQLIEYIYSLNILGYKTKELLSTQQQDRIEKILLNVDNFMEMEMFGLLFKMQMMEMIERQLAIKLFMKIKRYNYVNLQILVISFIGQNVAVELKLINADELKVLGQIVDKKSGVYNYSGVWLWIDIQFSGVGRFTSLNDRLGNVYDRYENRYISQRLKKIAQKYYLLLNFDNLKRLEYCFQKKGLLFEDQVQQ